MTPDPTAAEFPVSVTRAGLPTMSADLAAEVAKVLAAHPAWERMVGGGVRCLGECEWQSFPPYRHEAADGPSARHRAHVAAEVTNTLVAAGPKRCARCRNWLVWSRAGESWCEFCCDDGEDYADDPIPEALGAGEVSGG